MKPTLAFANSSLMVTDADLDSIERRLGFKFPLEFRAFYKLHNGGMPVSNRLHRSASAEAVLHVVLPVKHGRHVLEDAVDSLKVSRQILPEHLVPFGVDPGGDYFCFSTRDEDVGSVWIFRGDYFDDLDAALSRLADSLPEFLEGLAPTAV